jgi:hypothetical protein
MPTARGSGSLPDRDLVAKNSDVERFLLDNRQRPAHLVDSLADQIGDSGERQPGLGLLTGTAHHADAARPGCSNDRPHKCRLADTGVALDQQGSTSMLGHAVQKHGGDREFVVAADQSI